MKSIAYLGPWRRISKGCKERRHSRTCQTKPQEARRALVQSQAERQNTAVALIQAPGGGWRAPE